MFGAGGMGSGSALTFGNVTTTISMHWLIPTVATPVLALLVSQRRRYTLAALLVTAVLAGFTAFGIWPGFYAMFGLFFLVTCVVPPVSAGERVPGTFVLASTGVSSALLFAHSWYFRRRLTNVPDFLLISGPVLCIPRPSQTFKESENFTFLDALANQIPFAAAVSYAAAAAMLFSSRLGRASPEKPILLSALVTKGKVERVEPDTPGAVTGLGVLAAAVGALVFAAAWVLLIPMCKDGMDSSMYVMTHIDGRSIAWEQRGTMFWNDAEVWGPLLGTVALGGLVGSLLDSLIGPYITVETVGDSDDAKDKQADSASEAGAGGIARDLKYWHQLIAHMALATLVILLMALWTARTVDPSDDDDDDDADDGEL